MQHPQGAPVPPPAAGGLTQQNLNQIVRLYFSNLSLRTLRGIVLVLFSWSVASLASASHACQSCLPVAAEEMLSSIPWRRPQSSILPIFCHYPRIDPLELFTDFCQQW